MSKTKSFPFVMALVLATLIFGYETDYVRAQNQTPNKFKVGVFRIDGTIVPFAEYRHGLWWNPWAEQQQIDDGEIAPKSLGNHPEPWFRQYEGESSVWYFRPSNGAPVVLKTQELLQIDNRSDKNWAIMTDYPRKQTAKKDYHHSQLGMAVDMDLKVEGSVEIETNSQEARDIVSFIKPIFADAEASAIAAEATARGANEFSIGYGASSEERAKTELTIESLDRSKSAIDGRQIYYIALEKKYRHPASSPNSPSCENVSFLYGWVLKGKDGTLTLVNEKFGLTDCDGKERGSSVVLFSVMTLKNRTFIFTVEHGWEDESYIIYELTDFGINRLLETFGG